MLINEKFHHVGPFWSEGSVPEGSYSAGKVRRSVASAKENRSWSNKAVHLSLESQESFQKSHGPCQRTRCIPASICLSFQSPFVFLVESMSCRISVMLTSPPGERESCVIDLCFVSVCLCIRRGLCSKQVFTPG